MKKSKSLQTIDQILAVAEVSITYFKVGSRLEIYVGGGGVKL